jgi:hypothetical protein
MKLKNEYAVISFKDLFIIKVYKDASNNNYKIVQSDESYLDMLIIINMI